MTLPLQAFGLEYIPIYSVSLMGGQYFFTLDRSNFNGNATAHVAPVVKLDEEWSVLPLYRGGYQGTKSVLDSVGSGTLFQEQMDHRVSLAGLYTPVESPWKFKPSLNYKRNFLKETKDEDWGKGLFDYETLGLGLEAEKVYRDPFSVRVGYDFYYIRFPNYQSLESKAGVDPSGNPLGRETAGTNVLDTMNQQFSLSASVPLPYDDPKMSLQGSYRFLWQTFPDQPIINSQGQPNPHEPYTRQDFTNNLNLALSYPRAILGGKARMASAFSTGLAYNGSNQNTFDAGQTRSIMDTYSYWSVSAGPSVSVSWGDERRPSTAGLALTWTRQNYLGRLVQNAAGQYGTDRQYQDRYMVSLGYAYPIAKNFRMMAQTNMLWARSNMEYEKTYRYTYSTANYLFGFSYDY